MAGKRKLDLTRLNESRGKEYMQAAQAGPQEELREVEVALIDPAPWQPRKHFDPAALQELKESIQENGLAQPLVLRAVGDRYQVLGGERRLRAVRELGRKRVPAYVRSVGEFEARRITRAENRDRDDLSSWEDAKGLADLRDAAERETGPVSVRELARLEDMSRGSASEKLRIAEALTDEVWWQAFDSRTVVPDPEVFDSRTVEEFRASQANVSYRDLRDASKLKDKTERAARLYKAIHGAPPEWAKRLKPGDGGQGKTAPVKNLRGGGVRIEIPPLEGLTRAEARSLLEEIRPTLEALQKRAGVARGKQAKK